MTSIMKRQVPAVVEREREIEKGVHILSQSGFMFIPTRGTNSYSYMQRISSLATTFYYIMTTHI